MKFIMAPGSLLRSLLLCYFLLLLSAAEEQKYYQECPKSFHCGNLGEIHFPFTNTTRPECGFPIWDCDDPKPQKEVLLGNRRWFKIKSIHQDEHHNTIIIQDDELQENLSFKDCSAFDHNLTMPLVSPMVSFQVIDNITLFRCHHNVMNSDPKSFFKYTNCPDYDIYFNPNITDDKLPSSLNACSYIQLPFKKPPSDPFFKDDLFAFLTAEIQIEAELSESCHDCYYRRGGQCRPEGELCINGLAIGCGAVIMIGLFIILMLKQQRHNCSCLLNQSKNIYFDVEPDTNPGCVTVDFGVLVFSCEELEEATNHFDPLRELGNGGFGTVYYGKLIDGREVAIKRLYEHKRNHKREKQFMNEVQILTRLLHRNLVSLYGYTLPQNRGSLLVYEYIPNGTVADHLHGKRAKPGSLPWPVRMKLAIETASGLAYLHASDIVHRDVKTNNLLLDNEFCVKVADFGISRWFPPDVTHVSTFPQGTIGYVDPQYRESYQLTKKSDVYSFGVVLIELISSMPAVDYKRNDDAISLTNLAVKKIQERALTELVDHSLGFESNKIFKRMIVAVAELAFQCLQRDKEQRPSMDQVLEVLQEIESGKDKPEHLEVQNAGILNRDSHTPPPTSVIGMRLDVEEFEAKEPSPNTNKWDSEYTIPYQC